MIHRVICALCFICCVTTLGISQDAPYYFESSDIKIAYDLIFELKMDSAATVIERIKKEDPHNKLVHHVENYIDFLTLFITEDDSLFHALKTNKLSRMAEIRSGPADSPYHRFCQAEVHLQWALIRAKLNSGSFVPDITMINEINTAYRLLERNDQLFPAFIYNKKSLSLLHSLISYIPQVLQKLFRVKGSLSLGQREIQSLVKQTSARNLFSKEVHAIHAYMLLHLFNAPQQAWDVINHPELTGSDSPLSLFLRSTIALKLGKNEEVLELLASRSSDPGSLPFYFLDYLEGKAALHKGNHTLAAEKLERFVHHFKGKHFIKDAYQKLAWNALIRDHDSDEYIHRMAQVKQHGADDLEDDQQALIDAKSKQIPNTQLLQARLYFDGGYYTEALDLLQSQQETLKNQKATRVEYHYRMGRIHQMQGSYALSHQYYQECLDRSSRRSFFGCHAALQSGIIYETQHQKDKAVEMYHRCKSIKSKKYRNQLHKKAQAGLDRISSAPF